LYGTPVIATFVSIIYFFASPRNQSMARRLAASAHGVAISLLYIFGIYAMPAESDYVARQLFWKEFQVLALISCAMIVATLLLFKGRKITHGLQILNIIALVWTWFLIALAMQGQWH
jgi:hypothetical protein